MQGVGICGTSSPPPDYEAYRAYLAGEIVAFVQGILHLPTCREKMHLFLYLNFFRHRGRLLHVRLPRGGGPHAGAGRCDCGEEGAERSGRGLWGRRLLLRVKCVQCLVRKSFMLTGKEALFSPKSQPVTNTCLMSIKQDTVCLKVCKYRRPFDTAVNTSEPTHYRWFSSSQPLPKKKRKEPSLAQSRSIW